MFISEDIVGKGLLKLKAVVELLRDNMCLNSIYVKLMVYVDVPLHCSSRKRKRKRKVKLKNKRR